MGQQAGMGVGGYPLGHRLTVCPEDGDCMPSEASPGQLVESMYRKRYESPPSRRVWRHAWRHQPGGDAWT